MSTKEKIVLVGAGGHFKVISEAIEAAGQYEIAGIVDSDPTTRLVKGIPVIGDETRLKQILSSGCRNAFIAVGSIQSPATRIKIAENLRKAGFNIPVIRHPSSVISKSAKLADGVFVAAGAVIGPDVFIGENVIINTNSSVDHDCNVGKFVHIAPGCSLSGGVQIGDRSHLGTGSSVIEYIKIGSDVLIGAGSVVVKDIPSGCRAMGVPCKVVEK